MERRAKQKIARWAGPVLGSLLMSGCGGHDAQSPSADSIAPPFVQVPQEQEFGTARPLGDEDYRSTPAKIDQDSAPELEAANSLEASSAGEASPIASMPATMPETPWNNLPSTESAPGVSISESSSDAADADLESVSIEEYLAARAKEQTPSELDSVSVEDYLALRAQQQALSTAEQLPPVEGAPLASQSSEDANSYLVPRTVDDQFTKSDLPDFPSSPVAETPPAVTTESKSLPDWPTQSTEPTKSPPTSEPVATADRYEAIQLPAFQRLPETPASPVNEPTIASPVQPFMPPPANEPAPRIHSVIATPTAAKLVVRTPPRTPEMNGVVRDAEKHNGRGFDLATRGALLAARREFIEALREIALQLDKDSETRHFTQALASGLAALDEADDFSPRGSKLDVELDLPLLVRGHRTPALKGLDVKELSPLVAAGRYYTYAQEQLGMVAGGEMAGSLALYGLGKVHDMIHEQRLPKSNSALPKAMVFHQAALTTDPRNFRAANDLGVLLARAGRLEIAKTMLAHSLNVTSQPAVWRNLAAVHDQLGETQLSARARQFAAASQAEGAKAFPPGANPNTSRFAVQWVDPATFAASSRAASDIQPAPAVSPAALNNLQPANAPKAAPSWSPFGSFPSASNSAAGGSKGMFSR